MADEPAKAPPVLTEFIPSRAGAVSGIASANAPFVYFENAAFYGLLNGVGQVTLDAQRLNASVVDCQIASKRDPFSRPMPTPLRREESGGDERATIRVRMRRRCRAVGRA
jgi:hypothetical protein